MPDGAVLVIDGNNQLSRFQSVYTEAVSPDGLPIGGLYGMLAGVCKFLVQNPDHTSVVFVVDAGVPPWRRQECPEYKTQRTAKRSPQEEENHRNARLQVPHVRKVTRWLGCGFASAEGWEGDDVASALALRRCADRPVTIYASDKDYTELVDGRVRVYDGIRDRWFEQSPTYLLERLLDPKAGDNLDGVPGIGPAKAGRLLEVYRLIHERVSPGAPMNTKAALDGFLFMCREVAAQGVDPKASKATREIGKLCTMVVAKEEKVRANWRVTCLRRVAKACDLDTTLRCSPRDMGRFEGVAREYGLVPVLQELRAYRNVFGRLDSSWMLPASVAGTV